MERPPNFENKEHKSPEEKHSAWLREARVMLEGIGFHAGVGVSAYFILKSLGVDLPPEIIAVLPTPSTLGFMSKRRKDLSKE